MTMTSVWAKQLLAGLVVAGAAALAPVAAVVANAGATTVAAAGTHQGGPDYSSITGSGAGATSEQEVSGYGGSHKHLWVERQLYGPGVVDVPRVDNSVHQSH